jgi:hypothetical protein
MSKEPAPFDLAQMMQERNSRMPLLERQLACAREERGIR